MSLTIASLGFPRIGPRRELKTALEQYWSGASDEVELLDRARALRAANWSRQHGLGVTAIPSNDFSLYDHVLDTSVMVGAIPSVYGWDGGMVAPSTYFAMARGTAAPDALPAQEMTKWFDTNYHYTVPEFVRGQNFTLASTKPVDEYLEARALGIETRPVLVGPVTYLLLGKSRDETVRPLDLLAGLLPVYAEVLRRLEAAGATWIQIDEPVLVTDLDDRIRAALSAAYRHLALAAPGVKLMLTSYFGGLGTNLELALDLPVAGLHLDLVRAPGQLDAAVSRAPDDLCLSLGVVDGRNVWRSDLGGILRRVEPVVRRRGADRTMLAPSCSLLHVPLDVEMEDGLNAGIKDWLAFATQKLDELAILGKALSWGRDAVASALEESDRRIASRRESRLVHDPAVEARAKAVTPDMFQRRSPFPRRKETQRAVLPLPAFPTTTIGSFPQTDAVRKARAAHGRGTMTDADYEDFLRNETRAAIRWQEEIGLDVLVHGEFERNDMVQYFGEQLAGYAFTRHGWVQSYGSRCVRPPIIYGDVSRPKPMTVAWATYAQSQTDRPMKGMLTGPVTMLQWSFVRDDLERSQVCLQLALALRDEVSDLEKAGILVIQLDEPALREGLPLAVAERQAYLDWAVRCFRLASSGVADETQIHTHMCYSEFNDIIEAIGALDADVISIEAARSGMELLDAFIGYHYPNDIGPGVYDIHSPRRPGVEEMANLLSKASDRLNAGQIWVNPDCGLKTRRWEEVRPSLVNMVEAARRMRTS